MLATDSLLAQRLYIVFELTSIQSETSATFDGLISFKLYHGRSAGFSSQLNTGIVTQNITTGVVTPAATTFNGLNSQTHILQLFDKASSRRFNINVVIGFGTTASYVTYKGVNYTASQSFDL